VDLLLKTQVKSKTITNLLRVHFDMSLKLVKAHLKQLQTAKVSKSKKRKNSTQIKKTSKRRIVGAKEARTEGKRKTVEIIQEIEREKADKIQTKRRHGKTVRALASRKGKIATSTLEKLLARNRR
jgi:hypothetical protein